MQVINDATKQAVPINVVDNEDNTYTVELTPELAGTYTTNLTYGGLKVPFNKKTVISPTIDVSKVQVEGLEQSKWSLSITHTRLISSHKSLFWLSAFNSFNFKIKIKRNENGDGNGRHDLVDR